jgi:hypothetical protein
MNATDILQPDWMKEEVKTGVSTNKQINKCSRLFLKPIFSLSTNH